MDKIEIIIEKIENMDLGAKQWTGSDHDRVYVTRLLSRGRRQDMGFIRIDDETEEVTYHLTRNAAMIRDAVGSALEN